MSLFNVEMHDYNADSKQKHIILHNVMIKPKKIN